jgi:hypothetical protein
MKFISHQKVEILPRDEEGIELLADVVKELLAQSPTDTGLSGLGGII